MLTVRGALRGQRQRTIGEVRLAATLLEREQRHPIMIKASGHGLVSAYVSLPVDNAIGGKRKWCAVTGGFRDSDSFARMVETLRKENDENDSGGYGLDLILNPETAQVLRGLK